MLGVDAGNFLQRTEQMVQACDTAVPIRENAAVALGIILGSLAQQGRDKVTFVTSPGMESLGGWLEQLIAESSGKLGKGLVPVDGESLADPASYGADRVFVSVTLANAVDSAQEAQLAALQAAGAPIIRIVVPDADALGQEFFRWEIATAVACAVLGVNAFNQPDVEASKIATRRLTDEFELSGTLPEEHPTMQDQGLSIFAAGETAKLMQGATDLQEVLKRHLGTLTAGDYFAINAYVEMDSAHQELLQKMRHRVRDVHHVATTVGFGPRFLHSTGPPLCSWRTTTPAGARAKIQLWRTGAFSGARRSRGTRRPEAPSVAYPPGQRQPRRAAHLEHRTTERHTITLRRKH